MRRDAYYLIEARPALAEMLAGQVEDDFREALMEPVLYHNVEGGRTVWSDEDHCLTVKLSFLAMLRDWDPLSKDDDYSALFGTARLSAALFDKWWTIRRFEVNEFVEDLGPRVKATAHLIEPTGNKLVDGWIERIVATPSQG